MVREITLKGGSVALVDDADFEALSQYRWFLSDEGYAVRNLPRRNGLRLEGERRMHRMVLSGVPEVDHISGNKLDNQRNNLRSVPRFGNIQNRGRARKDSSTGVKNVSLIPNRQDGKRYFVRLCVNRKRFFYGYYETLEEASVAAREAREKYYLYSGEATAKRRIKASPTLPIAIDIPPESGPQKNSTTGVRGVSWHKGNGKFVASIRANRRVIWSAYFVTLDQASEAVAEQRSRLFVVLPSGREVLREVMP